MRNYVVCVCKCANVYPVVLSNSNCIHDGDMLNSNSLLEFESAIVATVLFVNCRNAFPAIPVKLQFGRESTKNG